MVKEVIKKSLSHNFTITTYLEKAQKHLNQFVEEWAKRDPSSYKRLTGKKN